MKPAITISLDLSPLPAIGKAKTSKENPGFVRHFFVFSPIRLCLKGFLLDAKAIGGLCRVFAGPGCPGNRPQPGSPGLQGWFPGPKSPNPKIAFGALSCQKMLWRS